VLLPSTAVNEVLEPETPKLELLTPSRAGPELEEADTAEPELLFDTVTSGLADEPLSESGTEIFAPVTAPSAS